MLKRLKFCTTFLKSCLAPPFLKVVWINTTFQKSGAKEFGSTFSKGGKGGKGGFIRLRKSATHPFQ